MSARRVLVLTPEAFGGRGGIAQYVRDAVTALAGLPDVAEVDVLPRTCRDALPVLPPGVRQAPPALGRAAYVRSALALARRTRPHVVVCAHVYSAPLAAVVARRWRARLVMALWGIEVWKRPSRLQRAAIDRADLALAISRDTRARTLAWSRIAPERVVVIANTVGKAFVPGDRRTARVRFGFTEEDFVLLCVSRLAASERYKGQDRVFAALKRLPFAPGGRRPLFAIAGDGDDRARLETLAREEGVAARVRFMGYVAGEDLPDLYRAADLFVMPSTGEGFGFVFLEAMACGTPALGVGVAGARDALGDGTLGGAPSVEDFAEALAAAVNADPPDPAVLSATVHERFGRAAFEAALADMWRRLEPSRDSVGPPA